MKFFDDYKDELRRLYSQKYGKYNLTEEDEQHIEEYYQKKIKSNYRPRDISLLNTTLQDKNEGAKYFDFVSYYDKCRESDYTFSLSHGCFDTNRESLILKIWSDQTVRRNDFKNKMKEAMADLNKLLEIMFNGYQRAFKEVANAIFGACGESSFPFYDIGNISNLTGTCFYVLLSTINEIEKVLGNRVILRNDKEVISYLSYLTKKDVNFLDTYKDHAIYKQIVNKISDNDIDELADKIISYCRYNINESMKSHIKRVITSVWTNLSDERKMVFKYNSNFIKFDQDSDIFYNMISNDFENYIDPSYSEKKFKAASTIYINLMKDFVFDDFLQADLLDLCDNYKREVVKLSDTDSTFCVANDIFNKITSIIKQLCNERGLSFTEDEYGIHAFKSIMVIGENMSDFFLNTIAGPKYQNSKNNKWKLKSEFLYKKILLLKVKKTYLGSIISQEGIPLIPAKFDTKNTEIIRSRYAPLTRSFLQEFFNELVMSDTELDIFKLLDIKEKYVQKFYEEIKDVKKASRLGTRADFKLPSAYKNDPFSVYQFKAAFTFNTLYPEFKTLPSDKTMIMQLKEFPEFKYERRVKKDEFINDVQPYGEFLNLINTKFKKEMIDLHNLETYIEEKKIRSILSQMNNPQVFTDKYFNPYQKDYKMSLNTYFLDTYGKDNPDFRDRLEKFFNKKKKTKDEESLLEVLYKDKAINRLAFSYYESMPESMMPLVDFDSLRLSVIDDRIARYIEALRLKVYKKSVNAKSKLYRTNIIKL